MSQDEARRYWNDWNAEAREHKLGRVPLEQARVIEGWLEGRHGLSILEAGCGTGWMCERLAKFGTVVGIDQADEVIERARQRVPSATFVAGDLLEVNLGSGYDVVVSLEVLPHVADQAEFLRRLRDALRPGGQLLLATQNKPVLSKFNRLPPPGNGQLRRWVDRAELRQLVEAASFTVEEMFVITPESNFGVMRVLAKASRLTKTDRLLARLGFGWTIMLSARAV